MTFMQTQTNHRRACRMLSCALTLNDDAQAWDGLSLVLQRRLTGYERACLLMASCRSMPPEDVDYVLEAVEQRECIRMPLPPLFSHLEEATWWADHAAIGERNAVLVAAFTSLPAREQGEFLTSAYRRSAL